MSARLSEAGRDELAQRDDARLRVIASRAHRDLRALRAAEQEHAHHALGVRDLSVVRDLDLSPVAARELHQLGRRAGVQTQLIHDLEAALAPLGNPVGWHAPEGSTSVVASTPMKTPKLAGFVLAAVVFVGAGCDCGGPTRPDTCDTTADCEDGVCVDHMCIQGDADAGLDASVDGGGVDASVACDTVSCGGACCRVAERCASSTCVPVIGDCASNDDCTGDSYCDAEGECTPYGVPPDVTVDDGCTRPIEIGAFLPAEQCRWTGGSAGDAFDSWNQVYSAPMVADFNLDDDRAVLAPSIVFSSFDSSANGGVLRIVDGRTCTEQQVLTDVGDRLVYASNFAIGDLDGAADGRPEIVAAALTGPSAAGGLVAFGVDPDTRLFRRLWYGRDCTAPGEPRHLPNDWANNNGPSMHDLDDDGVPEILFDRFVYDHNGCLLNPSETYDNYLRLGLFAVATDVDGDGAPELVRHDGVYRWDIPSTEWVLESYWTATDGSESERIGHVAVADLGDFPGAAGDAPGRPEIVVAYAPAIDSPASADGFVRVMSIGGEIVFGPLPLPTDGVSAGRGGPPTIGDFDGDGRREFGVAGGSRYTVFDLDCDIDGSPGCTRTAGLPRGVLWSRPSQDRSSNVTGSSVFDFDGDGTAEVVYGDECFARIYRGTDGEVLFSQAASSGTGYEFPVIADVDGDFNSEIVVAMTRFTSCPATDPIFTRGTSTFVSSTGIVVLRDAEDRWTASRPIWNQHAYHISHVSDDGVIPRTSAWTPNHSIPALNNFRMNAQGDLERLGAADLTVAIATGTDLCDATGAVELGARVCNRGTNPVPDGARVVFYAGDPDDGAPIACETVLPRLLAPAECTEVSCSATFAPDAMSRDAVVVVDPDGEVFECRDGNNRGVVPTSACLD